MSGPAPCIDCNRPVEYSYSGGYGGISSSQERDCLCCASPVCDTCADSSYTNSSDITRLLCKHCAQEGLSRQSPKKPMYCRGCHKRDAHRPQNSLRQCHCREWYCHACMITRSGKDSMCQSCFQISEEQALPCPSCNQVKSPPRPTSTWARDAFEICLKCRGQCCDKCLKTRPINGILSTLCPSCSRNYNPVKEISGMLNETLDGLKDNLRDAKEELKDVKDKALGWLRDLTKPKK
ncbi:MAG: hypothetical protein H3C47_10545 [Candidatus Cloacimonetes bacterium]|nr:hypothetical protein [Candidatus Cloacimonadota bacterium]